MLHLRGVTAGVAVGEESQQPIFPQVWHIRRCIQRSPVFRHSSQPAMSSGGSRISTWSRCAHLAREPPVGVSRPSSAARARGRRVVVAAGLPEARLLLVASPRPRTHFALFQKYRCGTSSRAGPPCSGSSGSPSYPYATQALPSEQVLERQVRGVAAVAVDHHVVGLVVDVREQRVERDALPVGVELGPLGHAVDVDRDLLGGQRGELLPAPASAARPTSPSIENVQASRCTRGVGPAERTGKSRVRYCPGGSREGSTSARRPMKPREIGGMRRRYAPRLPGSSQRCFWNGPWIPTRRRRRASRT